jgi:3' terminal RNA ribose 2'-O-methyltransferase Hen1
VGADEVAKLLKRGENWLPAHPARELIVRRYLCAKRNLVDEAIARLAEYTDGMNEEDSADADGNTALPGTAAPTSAGAAEQALEAPLSLNTQRMDTVSAAVQALGAASVIDLGCGEGKLLRRLLDLRELTRIVGVDVAHRSLEIAAERLHLERLPQHLAGKITLLHGSLTYRDARFEGFDVATVVEVIEHLDPPRLAAFERVLFEYAAPRAIVLTTPNREYNTLFAGMPAGRLRHTDHRFEWTRAEFAAWATTVATRFGYAMEISGIGPLDATHGAPTQMAVFTRQIQATLPQTAAQTQASAA